MTGWEPMLHELGAQRQGRLRAFATMLAGPSDADDLVQDAVIATFSKRRNFASVAQAEQYVRRAIVTKHTDSLRKLSADRRRARRMSDQEAIPDHADRVVATHTVDAAMAGLPPRVRACVVMRYLEDMSTRDTATALGLSEGAVKRYLSDGLATLNAALGTHEAVDGFAVTPVTPTKGGSR